jgi:LytTr DNA-binding domain
MLRVFAFCGAIRRSRSGSIFRHFRRIHRSAIVNLDHGVSCKPIDRSLCLKLSDGAEVIASRSGSRNLRDLFVNVAKKIRVIGFKS